jgi:hypothetical protein
VPVPILHWRRRFGGGASPSTAGPGPRYSITHHLSESRPGSDQHFTYETDGATGALVVRRREVEEEGAVASGAGQAPALGWGARRALRRARVLLSTVFLPAGYPSSVSPEYLAFQGWNVLQDLSTYLRGILATKAILEGVGVGKAGQYFGSRQPGRGGAGRLWDSGGGSCCLQGRRRWARRSSGWRGTAPA